MRETKTSTHRANDRNLRLLTASLTGAACAAALAGLAEAQINFDWPVSLAPSAGDVVTGDLDHDGVPEIVCDENRHIAIYKQDGMGGLTLLRELNGGGNWLDGPLVGDVDGDHNTDVVWVEHHYPSDSIFIFYNDGSGANGQIDEIATQTEFDEYRLGDLDGDGDLDIVGIGYYQSAVTEFINKGINTFVRGVVWDSGSDLNGWDLQLGDLDGDGDLDIAGLFQDAYFGHYPNVYAVRIPVLLNDGHGNYTPVANFDPRLGFSGVVPERIALGDIDGDGDLDIVMSAYNYEAPANYYYIMQVYVLVNEGMGRRMEQRGPILAGVTTEGYARGDLLLLDADLDGDIDIFSTSARFNGVSLLENLGRGRFAPWVGFPTGWSIYSGLTACDMNGDGFRDILYEGLAYLPNISPFHGPRLESSPFERGGQATLSVTNVLPGETVHFLYSLSGVGNSVGTAPLGGITLDLAGDIRILGEAQADENGTATLMVHVPDQAPLVTMGLQAVVRRGDAGRDSVKTPSVLTPVVP